MGTRSPEEIAEPFLTFRNVVVKPIATLSFNFLLYGMYIIIFGLCMHVLSQRKRSGLGLYRICTIALFILATLAVVMDTYGYTRQAIIEFRGAKTRDFKPVVKYLIHDSQTAAWSSMNNFVAVIMNGLADIMLIHRCYVLWGSKRVVLVFLVSTSFLLNALGLVAYGIFAVGANTPDITPLYLTSVHVSMGWQIATAIFNGILSLLTAGRIWWISREARKSMGMSIHARYKAIVAAILESGLLYPTALVTSMVIPLTLDPNSEGLVPVNFTTIAILMSGLAPTLITVRVAYGKSVDSVHQMVSIRYADRDPDQDSGTTGARRETVVHIHSHSRLRAMEADIKADTQPEDLGKR